MIYQTYQPKLTKTKLRRVEQYVNSQDPCQVPEEFADLPEVFPDVPEDFADTTENVMEGSCGLCETEC